MLNKVKCSSVHWAVFPLWSATSPVMGIESTYFLKVAQGLKFLHLPQNKMVAVIPTQAVIR